MLIEPGSRPPRPFPGMPWCLDNGAWSAHVRGVEWQGAPFRDLVEAHGSGADFVVAPDVVAGGRQSLMRSVSWLPWLVDRCPRVLIAVQDGMTPADLRPVIGGPIGLFVGGSTEWKLSTLSAWGDLAAAAGVWLHVARVNTGRRIRMCASVGADSFDGSGVSRFRATLPRIDAARRQEVMRWDV